MSIRAARRLQLVALILFAVSLLLTLLIIPLQHWLKTLYTHSEEIVRNTDVPVAELISNTLRLLIAVLYFVSLMKKDATPIKAAVIVYAILFAVLSLIFAPLIEMIPAWLLARIGSSVELASYSTLNRIVNGVTALPVGAAGILMALSLGGAYGKRRD